MAREDYRLYKYDPGYNPVKEWEEPLPSRPQEDPSVNVSAAKIQLCQKVHDLQVEVLESLGVDACRHYQQSKVSYILEAVQPTDSACPMCKRSLKGGKAIKTHIMAKHMDETPFQCNKCHKTFGNNQLLKNHMKTHTDIGKFQCDYKGCNKSFPALGRLNQHKKEHDPKHQVECPHCNKVFSAKRNLAPHEKTCKKRPGGRAAVPRDQQCPYCVKRYFHLKDLNYHIEHAHTSRSKQKPSS